MKQFRASLWIEDDLIVAQCLDVDVASQGQTEEQALAALKEALSLHFTPPIATIFPKVATFELEIGAA